MTDKEREQLPESLVDMAGYISPPHVDCERCDTFVGLVCETCLAAKLMRSAADEIKRLRSDSHAKSTRWFPQHAVPSLGYDSEAACQEYLDEVMCPCAGKPVKVTLTWEEPA